MNKSVLEKFYLIVLLVLIAPINSQAQEQCPVWTPIYLQCRDASAPNSFDIVAQAECSRQAYEECSRMWTLSPQGEWTVNVGAGAGIVESNDSGIVGEEAATRAGASGESRTAEENAGGKTANTSSNKNNGSPARVYSSVDSSAIDSIESGMAQCKASLKQTSTCCNDPMSCLTGDGSRDTSGAMMALQIVAGSATNMASLTGSCGTLGTVSTAMAAINAGLAFKCEQKISQCNSACGNISKRAENMLSRLTADTARCEGMSEANKNSCEDRADRNVSDNRRRLEKIVADADQCDNYGGLAVKQQSQAIASLYAAKVAGLCKKAATTDTANKSNNAFDVNCSDPTNAANPICQNQCNRANAASDPVCAQLLGLGTSGYGNGAGNGLADPNALGGSGSGSIDEFEDAQGMNDPNIMASANKANVSGGGGGGGVPSGASSGGGDVGAAGGGGEGGGLNTDIMGGASSRSGYTNPYVRSSIGGGGGYSASGGRVPASANGKPFNPRDFLPGGKMDPKRKLAGLAAATPEIGAVHGNIFTNITNRFLQVCLRDGLFDCESVRKNAKPRN